MKFLLLILLNLFFLNGYTQLRGLVVSIADGDTFTLLTENKKQFKIRLHGIDTPEKGQDYYQVAKTFLSNLIFQKIVEVEEKDIDRYGRTIGIAWYNGQNINEALLNAGLAWHYKKYDQNQKWSLIEEAAKKRKAGLWIDKKAIAPWTFRNNKKEVLTN